MSFIAKTEFFVGDRRYDTGDAIDSDSVNNMMKELCLVEPKQEVPMYTVILKANGGVGADIISQTEGFFQFPDCTFTAPANKEFKGWAMEATGEGPRKVGEQINLVQDSDFYAQWRPIVCTIKFNANGGSGKMVDVKRDKGTQYSLPACTFTAPSGKQFKGWSINKKDFVESITVANVTVYAMWEAVKTEQ